MNNPEPDRNNPPPPPPNLTFQGPVEGAVFNFGAQTGVTSTGANAVIHQEQKPGLDATQVLQLLAQLQSLLAEARQRGASPSDCAAAEQAARDLTTVAKHPPSPQAKEQAQGALTVLEKTSQGLSKLADVGEKLQKLLHLLGPALGALLGAAF